MPDQYPENGPFHLLLSWHLRKGNTRPDGISRKWGDTEFAKAALGGNAATITSNARKVGYWRFGTHHPEGNDLPGILKALFGDRQDCKKYREDLTSAFLRGKSPPDQTARRRFDPVYRFPQRPSGFVAREDILQQLHQGLSSSLHMAVYGWGGVGKSAIATEYAHRFKLDYRGIWFCHAETDLAHSLARLGVKLGVANSNEPDVENAAINALEALAQTDDPWLLIFDNAVNPQSISDFLPPPNVALLITTRFPDWPKGATVVPVDVLDRSSSAKILRSIAGDLEGAEVLADTLGRLPLALHQAAWTCYRYKISFADYAKQAEQLIKHHSPVQDYPFSVFATFNIAINRAAEECAEANELIAFLAQCSPDQIPRSLAKTAVDNETEYYRAEGLLLGSALAQRSTLDNDAEALSVHRIIQSVARSRAESQGIALPAIIRLTNSLVHLIPQPSHDDPTAWIACQQLIAHALALWQRNPERMPDLEDSFSLLNRSADYYQVRGQYGQALEILEQSFLACERKFGVNSIKTAVMGMAYADSLVRFGSLDKAEKLARSSLRLFEGQHLPPYDSVGYCLSVLGDIERIKGNYVESEKLHRGAIALWEQIYGKDSKEVGGLLPEYGRCLLALGKQKEALSVFERCVAIHEKVHGSESLSAAIALSQLGSVLSNFPDLESRERARELLIRGLRVAEQIDRDHPVVADLGSALGMLNARDGHVELARQQFDRAATIRKASFGHSHPLSVEAEHLSALHHAPSDREATLNSFKRNVAANVLTFGEHSPQTRHARFELGRHLFEQREFGAAVELIRPMIKSSLETWSAQASYALVDGVTLLGIAECLAGDRRAAFSTVLQAIQIASETSEATNSLAIAKATFYLGEIAWQEGDRDNATTNFENAIRLLEVVSDASWGSEFADENFVGKPEVDPGSLSYRRFQYKFARLLSHNREGFLSLLAYEQALRFHPEGLGSDALGLPATILRCSETLDEAPANIDASVELDRLIKDRELQLGSDHPVAHQLRNVFGIILYNIGLKERAGAVAVDAFLSQMRLLGLYHPWTKSADERARRILVAQGADPRELRRIPR
ncbi:tetratricopeptide repeat protein [Frankia sp. RB7]|nr:tetratricopeptide repeat protein [Frankia sp. RB7]